LRSPAADAGIFIGFPFSAAVRSAICGPRAAGAGDIERDQYSIHHHSNRGRQPVDGAALNGFAQFVAVIPVLISRFQFVPLQKARTGPSDPCLAEVPFVLA
jgi:hypothetical protein